MAKIVSKTYGEALFEIAMEAQKNDASAPDQNRAEQLLEEVEKVSGILKDNPEFNKMMLHPGIPKTDKLKAMEAVFKGRVSDELVGLIEIVIQKERYGELQNIFRYFIDKMKEVNGIGVAYVTSALPLTEAQQKAVEAKLLETTEYRSIEPHYAVDESLIGGMVIRINDRVVDSSIRLKLNDLTRQLLQIQIG